MNLVVDKVRELEHIDVANRYRLLKLLACHAVEERRLAGRRQAGRSQQRLDLAFLRTIEDRGTEPDAALHSCSYAKKHLVVELQQLAESRRTGELLLHQLARVRGVSVGRYHCRNPRAQSMCRPAQMCLENLADVHTRRHAERIEHNLDGGSVGQVRHVLFRKYARDHALVTVTAGHLVAD